MKVLVILEDPTNDGFIARPVIEALLAELEIPARVDVLTEPHLRGASEALNPSMVARVIEENPMTDFFVLVVDRDCDRDGHVRRATDLEARHAGRLITCLAEQELEVWMLALYKDRLGAKWGQIRAHCDPKEEWAEPLLEKLGANGPGKGRKRAMSALAGRLATLRSLCDEVGRLQDRLAASRPKRP